MKKRKKISFADCGMGTFGSNVFLKPSTVIGVNFSVHVMFSALVKVVPECSHILDMQYVHVHILCSYYTPTSIECTHPHAHTHTHTHTHTHIHTYTHVRTYLQYMDSKQNNCNACTYLTSDSPSLMSLSSGLELLASPSLKFSKGN